MKCHDVMTFGERFVKHHMKMVILGEFVVLPYRRKDVFVG